jgi:hypothetical protein
MQMIAIDASALDDLLQRVEAIDRKLDALAPPPDRLSIPAAAEYCGVTVKTFRSWIAAGRIEAQGPKRLRSVARVELEPFKKR